MVGGSEDDEGVMVYFPDTSRPATADTTTIARLGVEKSTDATPSDGQTTSRVRPEVEP